jgi:2-polyprenyl-3-methyl-5-hydroxy-6-metoxy-1,4-benzoquinol methylase
VESDEGRYAAEIDLSNDNDSHVVMIKLVGGGKRVLDVGCWTGQMGAVLSRFNPRVVGIELDTDAAAQAAKALDDVVVADVSDLDFRERFGSDAFDAIVFGDVLEHIKDPVSVLRSACTTLSDRGFVVASIPNVAHGSVRLRLLAGDFSYTEVGLLDRTHLRFFTRESMTQMFTDAGLTIVELRRTTIDPTLAPDQPIDPATVPTDLLQSLRDDEDANTYQFVVKALVDDRTNAIRHLHERLETATTELDRSGPLNPAFRIATITDLPLPALVPMVLEREFSRRLHVPVEVRSVRPGAIPRRWGPDVVVSLSGGGPAAGDPDVVDFACAPDELCRLANRLASTEDLRAARTILRALDRVGDAPGVVVVASEADHATTIEHLIITRQDGDRVLVIDDGVIDFETSAHWEAIEGVAVRPRPVDPIDWLSIVEGAEVLVSDRVDDLAVAASFGVSRSRLGSREEIELTVSRSDRDEDLARTIDLDERIDALVRSISLEFDRATQSPDDDVLRRSLASAQARMVDQRRLLADVIADLELEVERGRGRIASLQSALGATSALDRILTTTQAAAVQLQEQARVAATAAANATPPKRSLMRRGAGRLRRALHG